MEFFAPTSFGTFTPERIGGEPNFPQRVHRNAERRLLHGGGIDVNATVNTVLFEKIYPPRVVCTRPKTRDNLDEGFFVANSLLGKNATVVQIAHECVDARVVTNRYANTKYRGARRLFNDR